MVAPINKTLEVKYKLDVDFSMILHRSWLGLLNPIMNDEYMRNVMVFLHEMYKTKYITPAKTDIFKPFKLTDLDELKVVIISDSPYINLRHATGLALANPNGIHDISRELEAVYKCIEESVYSGFYLDFDWSLESWADQGVLLLNSALTHIENYKELNPYDLWRNFMRQVVREISETQTGVQFLLLGNEAQYFERYINKSSSYVYSYEHPRDAVRENRMWCCPYFEEINTIICDNNGPEFCIEW